MNPYLSLIVKCIHLVLTLIVYVTPLFTKNTFVLYMIILCNTFILTGWYLFDGCIITRYENFLEGSINHKYIYFFTDVLKSIFGHNEYDEFIVSIFPLCNTAFCLYKIDQVTSMKQRLHDIVSDLEPSSE